MKVSLKSARINANLTQKEVASELKISKHTLLNWEKGKNKIPYASLLVLCDLYGCTLNDIKY